MGARRFAEMRFHWGLMFNSGSEHRVNGMRYMGEIQLVHFNIKRVPKQTNMLFF